MLKDQELILNFEDDIIAGACVARDGEISNQRVRDALAAEASAVS
jgi:NAD(P) transhydrogenase subunit alpha